MLTEQAYSDDIEQLRKLIKEIKVAMLTTINHEKRLVSRPVMSRDVESGCDVWFFSSMDSATVRELHSCPKVNIAYVNVHNHIYVSISGHAEIVHDEAKTAELWNESMDKIFFPGGKEDPNLVLIKVTAETAESWTSGASSIGRLFRFIAAAITGDRSAPAEQRTIDLSERKTGS